MKVRNILNDCTSGESTSADKSLISESSLINDVAGTCPKCKRPMDTAAIADGTSVYHCSSGCRVSSPLKDCS